MKECVLTVEKTKFVTPTVAEMTLSGDIPPFVAGQFLHISVPGFMLRRPFCITQGDSCSVTVLFAVVGAGTAALSKIAAGTKLNAILPIGNGFPVPAHAKNVLVIGGGLGVAPLLPVLAQHRELHYKVLLGFGSAAQAVETDEFRRYTEDVTVATDDGSAGYKGRVTELAREVLKEYRPDVVYVCGPTPMIRAAQSVDFGCPAYVSMEARMGCGVGACLVCTCPVKHGETVGNVRVCVDGPVFPLADVVV